MNKIAFILVAQILSVSAMASTTLTKLITNGTVSPQYQTRNTCAINGNLVKINIQGGAASLPHTLVKQAQFTNDVPNEFVAESLANDAAQTPAANRPGPIGGGVTSYSATVSGSIVYLYVTSGGVPIRTNSSESAKKLLRFIDKNCK